MKVKYVIICFFFSILFIALSGFNLLFALSGVFLFILGLILTVIKVDQVLNR